MSEYQYPFEPASQDRFFNIDGYTGHMLKELILARPDLFNETNDTIEKFAANHPKVDIRTFRHGFGDKVSYKKALNEGIPRVFIKCNKNNQHAIVFIPTVWCDQNIWNQPEHVVEPPVVAPVIDAPIVEDVAETEKVLEEEEVVPPPNVSIPEPDPIPTPTASNPNQKLDTTNFNGREYYLANDLKEKYPELFRGIKYNHIRDIIRKHDIPKNECVYAMLVKKDWKLMSESVDKAKLFISKDWWDEKMFEKSTSNDEEVKVKSKYDMAPPVIEVSDEMMFKDLNGEPIPIEIRGNLINGQLDEDNMYFNLDDTSKGFGIPNLYTAVLNNDRDGYIENEDYKKFYVKNSGSTNIINDYICATRKIEVKVFLTYDGLIRVLYVSRNANSKKFRKWATRILFTHQFANKTQKQELASTLLGQPCDVVKRFLSMNASDFFCIYLIIIGTVDDLRCKYNIPERYPDNYLVIKLGKGEFNDRHSSHSLATHYGKKIRTLYLQCIDDAFMGAAETDLKLYLTDHILDIPTEKIVSQETGKEYICSGKKELFVYNPQNIDKLKEMFNTIGKNYAGRTKRAQHDVDMMKKDVEYKELLIETLKEKLDLANKQVMFAEKQVMFAEKQLEYLRN